MSPVLDITEFKLLMLHLGRNMECQDEEGKTGMGWGCRGTNEYENAWKGRMNGKKTRDLCYRKNEFGEGIIASQEKLMLQN